MQILLLLSSLLLSLSVYAQYPRVATPSASIFAEYSHFRGELEWGDKIQLDGFAFGISHSPHQHGLWAKFDALSEDDFKVDYNEFAIGGQYNFLNDNGLYLLGTLGLGYAWADSEYLSEEVTFLSIPLGLEVGLSFNPNMSFYAGVGYKWLLELQDDRYGSRCNDGTWSNSVGPGTCSWHGGVSYTHWGSEDLVGNVNGFSYRAGMRFNF